MRFTIILLAICLCCLSCQRKAMPSVTPVVNTEVTRHDTVKMLLGHCDVSVFEKDPYNAWYNKYSTAYQTDSSTIDQLKPMLENKSVEIFLGSWCGDSKREVPRMMKVLQAVGLSLDSTRIIFVDNDTKAYKQSPQHEEAGKNIFRVPTFIFYNHNQELGRIVETPVASLEKDMLSILRREDYTPNYKAVGWWLKNGKKEGTVSDKKMKQYAIEVKPLCKNSGELNSYGYLLLGINKTAEALNIFRLNTLLFPGDANVYDSLGEAYLKAGDTAMAIDNYQKVLELQPDNANAKTMLEKIKAQ